MSHASGDVHQRADRLLRRHRLPAGRPPFDGGVGAALAGQLAESARAATDVGEALAIEKLLTGRLEAAQARVRKGPAGAFGALAEVDVTVLVIEALISWSACGLV